MKLTLLLCVALVDPAPNLFDAAKHGHIAAFEKLTAQQINQPHPSGDTLLSAAARYDQHDLIRILVDGGADHSAVDTNGNSALHHAVHHRNYASAQVLLAAGADPDARNDLERTPLIVAAHQGQVPMARLLLDHGADLETFDLFLETPFLAAAKRGRTHMMRFLLARGADSQVTDSFSAGVVDYAHLLRQIDVQVMLAEFKRVRLANPVKPSTAYDTPDLFQAILDENPKALRALPNAREQLNQPVPGWGHPLAFAFEQGTPAMIDLLIELGADWRSATKNPGDLWINSVRYQNWNMMRLLLNQGANPNHISAAGNTALRVAVRANEPTLIGWLQENGATLCGRTKTGKAIHIKNGSTLKAMRKAVDKAVIAPNRASDRCEPLGDIYTVGCEEITPPRFTSKVPPHFPSLAKGQGVTAAVMVSAILHSNGDITDITPLGAGNDWAYGFEIEAAKALRQWKFQPATHQGKAIDVRMTLKIDFALQRNQVRKKGRDHRVTSVSDLSVARRSYLRTLFNKRRATVAKNAG